MNLKKPKFWDYKSPNIFAYLLLPLALLIQLKKLFETKSKFEISKIKTICVGNIYIGGTGKTSLSIKINEILNKRNIKSCFIKKYYKDQIDEQQLLKSRGKLFISSKRQDAINQAAMKNYEIAIFDDGLQDMSVNYNVKLVCFNNLNWIGNGLTIPAGPLRENLKNLKKYQNVFLNGNEENLESIKKDILKINSKINIHIGKYVALNIDEFDINSKYLVFSGIGNHQTFVSMIKNYGFNICKNIEFPDHYIYKKKDIKKILKISDEMNCKIITTEKDYLRLNLDNINKIKFIKSNLKIVDEEKLISVIMKKNETN
jgi:tetraacyldisaccharide 4'-kinase